MGNKPKIKILQASADSNRKITPQKLKVSNGVITLRKANFVRKDTNVNTNTNKGCKFDSSESPRIILTNEAKMF